MRTDVLTKIKPQSYKRVGMKPLSERDENLITVLALPTRLILVGMKPLSERDENSSWSRRHEHQLCACRNEATL